MELNEARVDELDIEALVKSPLATRLGFWIEGSLDQEQRFQKVLFPRGLTFDDERFGTLETCLAFSYLREISRLNSNLVMVRLLRPFWTAGSVSPFSHEQMSQSADSADYTD
jgi:hypothetical protein